MQHQTQTLRSSTPTATGSVVEDMAMFATMQIFHSCGGVLSGDDMATRLGANWTRPVSVLARWIVDRRVIHFHWRGTLMLPVFQFEPADGAIGSEAAHVIGQLVNVLDADEVRQWFVEPHCLLTGDLPVRLIKTHTSLVIEAARMTHFAHI